MALQLISCLFKGVYSFRVTNSFLLSSQQRVAVQQQQRSCDIYVLNILSEHCDCSYFLKHMQNEEKLHKFRSWSWPFYVTWGTQICPFRVNWKVLDGGTVLVKPNLVVCLDIVTLFKLCHKKKSRKNKGYGNREAVFWVFFLEDNVISFIQCEVTPLFSLKRLKKSMPAGV